MCQPWILYYTAQWEYGCVYLLEYHLSYFIVTCHYYYSEAVYNAAGSSTSC